MHVDLFRAGKSGPRLRARRSRKGGLRCLRILRTHCNTPPYCCSASIEAAAQMRTAWRRTRTTAPASPSEGAHFDSSKYATSSPTWRHAQRESEPDSRCGPQAFSNWSPSKTTSTSTSARCSSPLLRRLSSVGLSANTISWCEAAARREAASALDHTARISRQDTSTRERNADKPAGAQCTRASDANVERDCCLRMRRRGRAPPWPAWPMALKNNPMSADAVYNGTRSLLRKTALVPYLLRRC